jgi:hypothetical protein
MLAQRGAWLAAALALLPGIALAQEPAPADRPREQDLFGAPEKKPDAEEKKPDAEEKKPQPPGPPPGPAGDERDRANLGAPEEGPRLSTEAAPDNPLTIGGQFYLRAQTTALQSQALQNWTYSSPSLLDAYFDARPNNRVRGFVLGRMAFDPTLPTAAGSAPQPTPGMPSGDINGAGALNSLTAVQTRGPQVVLDQMWLRFDLKHTVFITAGKQHVRWGTARLWTPADFLHLRRRNPLDVFDARTGTSMLKIHLPWESRGWNFYGYALTEGPGSTPTVSDIAAAGRAEVVLGTSEAGIGAVVQRHRKPKIAADLSAGIWDLDFYGEFALRYGSEIDRVGVDPSVTLDPVTAATITRAELLALLDQRYPVYTDPGRKVQVVGGVSWSHQYADKDVITIGGEYFYNQLGYDDSKVYPGLVLPRPLAEPATFFYLGRQYAGIFVALPYPWSLDLHSFNLSVLGNLSDGSYIGRFDYGLTLLTHLHLEAFVAVHFGRDTGEFRFAIPELGRAPALLDLGVALRVSL